MKISIKEIVLCSIFVALISIGAFLKVPVPVVPFTLQFLFTMLAGLLLGGKLGFIAVAVYILLGLIGLPVFTEGGGLMYLLKPTFGYIIGFALGAYATGTIAHQEKEPSYKRLLVANFMGLAIVYLFGMIYLYLISNLYLGQNLGLWPVFLYGFVLAVPGDIFLCLISAWMGKRLIPIVGKEV